MLLKTGYTIFKAVLWLLKAFLIWINIPILNVYLQDDPPNPELYTDSPSLHVADQPSLTPELPVNIFQDSTEVDEASFAGSTINLQDLAWRTPPRRTVLSLWWCLIMFPRISHRCLIDTYLSRISYGFLYVIKCWYFYLVGSNMCFNLIYNLFPRREVGVLLFSQLVSTEIV